MKINTGNARILFFLACLFLSGLSKVFATTVRGKVVDEQGASLGFSSIIIQGEKKAVVSNESGIFSLEVRPGRIVLICQHIGYETVTIDTVARGELLELKIVMKPTMLNLTEVVVRPGTEDPALEIIRNAIKKRKFHKEQVATFQCEAYIKGMVRTLDFPNNFFGQPINFEDGDTSKKKIIFLSESISDVYFKQPDESRVVVRSTRVSGQSNGFGLSSPILISFYDNIVALPKSFNPRGFISPIADGALNYYTYRYLGMFQEGNVLINRIQVIPKRKYEPLFSGFIQVVENEWNLHSVSLSVDKSSQLELAKKVLIEQQYGLIENNTWMVKTQSIFPEIQVFGFDASGYFTTVYNNYSIQTEADKKNFGRTLIKYDSLSNKRSEAYWNQYRPIPLAEEEANDFNKKEALERKREDPAYLDSLDRLQNKLTPMGMLLMGQTMIQRSKNNQFAFDPLAKSFSYNAVEGWALQFSGTFQKSFTGRKQLSLTPVLRYGTSNKHFTPFVSVNYRFGKKYVNNVNVAFGKKIFQFNNNNPIPQVMNTVSTLFYGNNFMKIYEATFLKISMQKSIGGGFDLSGGLQYQNRMPLANTVNKIYGPNFPTETGMISMDPHQSLVSTISVKFRPGARYIELPDRVISVFSKSPVFLLEYSKGFKNQYLSDVDFDRVRASMKGDLNFKIGGELKYKVEAGSFLRSQRAELPDHFHFNGNLTRVATPYVESFQVAPYYAFSGMHRFFSAFHIEYRMNGLLTNKIPLVRKYNLRLVTGANMIWYKDMAYEELFLGVDNLFKLLRVDYVRGFGLGQQSPNGIRIGIRGFSSLFTDY